MLNLSAKTEERMERHVLTNHNQGKRVEELLRKDPALNLQHPF